jgi:hypothetical protein
MSPEWADAATLLKLYEAFLSFLVWLLASFACLAFLASVVPLLVEHLTAHPVRSHSLERQPRPIPKVE